MEKNAKDILKSVFGYDEFRPGQEAIIQNVLAGRDTLAVMPTGGGKSLCYQIPALILKGLAIVVSPLISLMQDQVGALQENGVAAAFLNSSLSFEEYSQCVQKIKNGKTKILYLSPEALAAERIRSIFRDAEISVSLITIDEAHCISEWGHDFRPDYMEIASFRKECGGAVCLALTATATKQVQSDIIKNLDLKNPAVLVSSFDRPNIFLEARPRSDGVFQVVEFLNEHKDESGIIYCLSRKEVDSLSVELQKRNFSALPYHAGLTDKERSDHQNKFIKGQVDIIVATVAFGMGINKPDARFVIHYSLPKSIEEYYQEIGRAGRDGLESHALLLYSAGDIHRIRFFFKDKDETQAFKAESLLQAMAGYAQSRSCRRAFLLNYFGESYNPSAGKNRLQGQGEAPCCDICASGGIPLQDVTVPAQKFMSCALRVNQRFGAAHLIDILLGSRNEKVKKFNHNFLSTWGIGTELSKQAWFELADAMQDAGLIERAGEYNIVRLTRLGKEMLQNRDKIELPVRIDFSAQKKAALSIPKKGAVLHKKRPLDDGAQKLFEAMRAWRKKRAEEENIPPYYIFSDNTITDIANKRPSSRAQLLEVNGIGEAKAQKFGADIIRLVSEYSD